MSIELWYIFILLLGNITAELTEDLPHKTVNIGHAIPALIVVLQKVVE